MSRNKKHKGAAFGTATNGAAAPLGLCSLFLLISFLNIMNIYGYSLYIPYIFHVYMS